MGKKMLSGMQKQVLGLYRGFLRSARSKPPEDRRKIESVVSAEFRRNAAVDRKSFVYIEYLLRRGQKQLQQLNSPHTSALSTIRFSNPWYHVESTNFLWRIGRRSRIRFRNGGRNWALRSPRWKLGLEFASCWFRCINHFLSIISIKLHFWQRIERRKKYSFFLCLVIFLIVLSSAQIWVFYNLQNIQLSRYENKHGIRIVIDHEVFWRYVFF